ncbi:MAG: pyridoxamine 5'-phosphate oxidase family protein [Anaerovoracaceae bacterium]|jgi:nitroimidazol reductase NimA-like FMN-containing flavoprotein (pyridoxamine 5'-phosphate oxidase superfamily)
MRRKDREVTEIDRIFDIVDHCSVVHLGMVDRGHPYVTALNFGYERDGDDLILYFHSAREGRRMDILRDNPEVFFQMHCVDEFIRSTKENPCSFCWRYDSVTGSGKVEFIEDPQEKAHALNCLIGHLDHASAQYAFPEKALRNTCVYKVRSGDIAGKHHE